MSHKKSNTGRPRMKYEDKTRPLYVSLPNPLADRVVEFAQSEGLSIQGVIRDCVRNYLPVLEEGDRSV